MSISKTRGPVAPSPSTRLPEPAPLALPLQPALLRALTPWVDPNRDDRTPPAKPAASYQLIFGDQGPFVSANGLPASALEAGKPVRIGYFKGLSVPESEVESIVLHAKADGQELPPMVLTTHTTRGPAALVRNFATLDLPESVRGELEYSFEVKTHSGKSLWDDNGGAGYRANITPKGGATVAFDQLFGEQVTGTIQAGETLRVNYDADRLRKYLGDQAARGSNTLGVDAYVSFDGKEPQSLPMARFDSNGQLQTLELAVEVPDDAKTVQIWFRGKGVYSEMFDSNFGANYSYTVEGPSPRSP
jgi:hypothetical protein